MEKTLNVYLRHEWVGELRQDKYSVLSFSYVQRWLENSAAIPLSYSLPLRKESFRRNECRGFFAGILPEESKRVLVAKALGISVSNDFSMLEKLGGECAGAVTFLPPDQPLPQNENTYRPLTPESLAELLKILPTRPLMVGEDGVRLSLAGAQDKIPLFCSEGKFFLPLNNAPSSHILKLSHPVYKGLVFNEAFCMRLAAAIGLPAAHVEIGSAQGIDYLLVERYDRTRVSLGAPLEREHQEDFCQASGIVSEKKYQSEGGPSLKQCFALLRAVSSSPVIDLQRLLDAVIFNFLIGNNDAHGKNFSLLYKGTTLLGRSTQLAPLYDILSTAYYPQLSPFMAMKIGGEKNSEIILPKHFEKFSSDAGLSPSQVKKRVPEMIEKILTTLPTIGIGHPVAAEMEVFIRERCERIGKRF